MADTLIIDSAQKIFADTCNKAVLDAAETGEFPESIWRAVRNNGFHQLALADSGVGLAELFAVVRVAGQQALPVPLAEALLANRWLGYEGEDLLSIGLAATTNAGHGTSDGDQGAGRRTRGQLARSSTNGHEWTDVPWGRNAARVLGVTPANELFVAHPSAVAQGFNLAGEPRDRVAVERMEPVRMNEPAYALLALARAAASTGALEQVLEMGLRYAGEREQFGRPIARFQAIQHILAVAAAEVAAAVRATDAAVDAIHDGRFELEVAAAKSRVGEAIGTVVEAIHQVHGAIGFTYEHQLHHFTRRLWAWREEYGGEVYWQRKLGEKIAVLGADSVWDFIATLR